MRISKKTTSDLLFGFQVVCAIIFGLGQFLKMLTSVQGVSGSMFLFTLTFLVINTYLGTAAYRVAPSRIMAQTLSFYILGVAVYGGLLATLIARGGFWDSNDQMTAALVVVGIVGILYAGIKRGLSWTDPMVKGWLALFFKAMPQLSMALKIARVGGAGISAVMVVMFHALTLTRILMIFWAIKEAGWDRNRRGMALAEIGNETSWLVVTAAWVIWLLNT